MTGEAGVSKFSRRAQVRSLIGVSLGLIGVTVEAAAGSWAPDFVSAPTVNARNCQSIALSCFVNAGGSAASYNIRCVGHRKIGEVEAAMCYLDLPPAPQVAADVAAEEVDLGASASGRR